MQNLMSSASNSDKLSILLSIMSALIAVAVAYIFYLLSIQRFKLNCHSNATRVIGVNDDNMLSNVKIMYSDKVIPRLNRVIYAIWNSGDKVINSNDIADKDSLRFEVDGDDKILSCRILKRTKEINDVSYQFDDRSLNSVKFNFDHLSKNDGFVVEILHTAERKYLPLKGTIKGLDKITYTNGYNSQNVHIEKIGIHSEFLLIPLLGSKKTIGYIASLVGLSLLFIGIFVMLFPKPIFTTSWRLGDPTALGVSFVGAGLAYATLGLAVLWITRRAYPRALHCEELN